MKLATLLSEHMEILPVFERLGMELGFGEASEEEVCRDNGISPDLFHVLCEVHSREGFVPDASKLDSRRDIASVLTYLRSSHSKYTTKWFPLLHSLIHSVLSQCEDSSSDILNRFYDEYDAEVSRHFNYEENVVFPYIENLLTGRMEGEFRMKDFEANHTNIDEKLSDLKSIIIKYLPREYNSAARYELLTEIARVEDDHAKHTRVEDMLLVPLVERLEAEYDRPIPSPDLPSMPS